MKIRHRLTLFGAAVVAGAILVFGALIIWLAQAAAPNEQVTNMGILADETVASLSGATAEELMASDPAVQVDISQSTEPFVVVLTEAGETLYSTGQHEGNPPKIPAAVVVEALQTGSSHAVISLAPDVEIQAVARLWQTSGAARVVVAGQSTAFIQAQLEGLRGVVFVAVVITLIVSLAAGWIVSGRALRPLRELAETTDAIGSTADLTRRLPATESKDEVGALTTSFNSMLERLQRVRAELASSLNRQQQFVADASHELRTPLTTIRNNAGFLAERTDAAPEDRQAAIGEIREEADRMSRLVDDLLTLARNDNGLVVEMGPLELTDIVRQAAGRSPDVVVESETPVEVQGDADALRRLFVILINNGLRHGEPPVKIRVSKGESDAQVVVRDHGPGIPEDAVARVFDRFYQADGSRNPQGAGLGLAIARQIAQDHGGTLAVGDHPDGGAVFTLSLPA